MASIGGRGHRVDRDDDAAMQAAAANYYRERLLEPAVRPWTDGHPLAPVTRGPTWQIGKDGRWLLPEFTLGWEVLGFLSHWLNPAAINRRDRYEFTLEQARMILWWYSVNLDASWVYRDGCWQRVKGHGKDPIIAAVSINALVGPDDPVEVDERTGVVRGAQAPDSLVQIAATTQQQTGTTMKLYPLLLGPEIRARFRFMPPGKTMLDARQGLAHLDAVTSNPDPLEGNRTRLVLANETHHWDESNAGLDMDAVLRRNMRKNAQARVLRATNAFRPGAGSVAERDREAYDSGELKQFLYDTVEAPKHAELGPEHGAQVIPMVRGDSVWLTTEMFQGALDDPRDPDSDKRRFWYNQVQAAEEQWLDPQAWADVAPPKGEEPIVLPGEKIVMFGDGSKSDDATALVACRVSDGHVWPLGVWQRPKGLPKEQHAAWRVPPADVDRVVAETFDVYKVLGFFFDPSDVLDDSGSSIWTPWCDVWHQRYGKKMPLKASLKHSVIWDMRTLVHQKEFTEAAQQFVTDVERGDLTHDGDPRLTRHVKNARRSPGRYGVSLQKESRESPKKIDLAVCAVGARYMRRLVVNGGKKLAGRSGRRARS